MFVILDECINRYETSDADRQLNRDKANIAPVITYDLLRRHNERRKKHKDQGGIKRDTDKDFLQFHMRFSFDIYYRARTSNVKGMR